VHEFDVVMDTFSHPRYEIIATDRVHDGEAAVREYFRETRTAFPDQRNELIELRHADDAVIVEFWLRGTHRGALAGVAPTGRAFECRMACSDEGRSCASGSTSADILRQQCRSADRCYVGPG
jgi:ketosteroid isomerase-like protein